MGMSMLYNISCMWDETDTVIHEYTLVVCVDNVSAEKVYDAADEIIYRLSQSSVLIQKNHVSIDYYGGK